MTGIVLDTNAYSRLYSGDGAVLHALGSAETVYMSIFVLGELYWGFRNGTRERENRSALEVFLSRPTVKMLNATSETAEMYCLVKQQLKKAGAPIPHNDIWVAAHALEKAATLVTYDKHFRAVAGLRIWDGL